MNFHNLIQWDGYLYLKELSEPENDTLRLIISPSKKFHSEFEIKQLPAIQVDFNSYMAYSIVNECFDIIDEPETSDGKKFRIYTKSTYLDYIKSTALEKEILCSPENYVHYQVCCLEYVMDIVACEEPKVVELVK